MRKSKKYKEIADLCFRCSLSKEQSGEILTFAKNNSADATIGRLARVIVFRQRNFISRN